MYNEKQTKNIITKESIASELQARDKIRTPFLIIYVLVMGVFFSAIYFLGIKSINAQTIHYVFFFCVLLFICLLPLCGFVFFKGDSLIGIKGKNAQNFCVITDEVVYKDEKTYKGGRKLVHFSRVGAVDVNPAWHQITSTNDVYYIVVRNKDSKRALKCYPTKLYEYKE